MYSVINIRAILSNLDPWLLIAIAIGAGLRLDQIDGFDNIYYAATVSSMLQSPCNFLFASFDPGCYVMVDKPPVSFWVQSFPAAMFGVTGWSVALPQIIAGTLAIPILYTAIKPAFGRVAATLAAAFLAIIPSSVVIDSGNEPDSLLSFVLLLTALCVIRASRTGKRRWLFASAILIGIGFNIKMLVAFMSLPAILLYTVLSSRTTVRRLVTSVSITVAILMAISLSWMTIVAVTPPENRPYVGSTKDDSIWTLALEYNGLDRFTSFIGPRQRPSFTPFQAGQPNIPGPQPDSTYYSARVGPGQPSIPLPVPPGIQDNGLFGLISNPLAGQLGWLLPLGSFSLTIMLIPLFPERVYKRPLAFIELVRKSPFHSQIILWAGWFTTAVIVFDLANATTTHPYYLSGMAVPLAAILGIGLSFMWSTYQRVKFKSLSLPTALVGSAIYQIYVSGGLVGDLVVTLVLLALIPAVMIMVIAIARKLTSEPLSNAAVMAGVLSLLLIPLAPSVTGGDRIINSRATPANRTQPPPITSDHDRVDTISSFLIDQGDPVSVFKIGTVNAREAAPFILAKIPAVAIGGFSGSDPVFSVDSFRTMAERGELQYFLMPNLRNSGPSGNSSPQENILRHVRLEWEDVSRAVKLPPGTLYKHREAGKVQ